MTVSRASVDGTCTAAFDPVRDLFAAKLEAGDEAGASLCVMSGGEVVVDLWGGVADVESGRSWERDTLANTYSLTKTMTALAVLVLIDRGLVDPDAPVGRYWPEFAAGGKGGVLVRHLLGHTSGLSGWDEKVSIDDVYDQEAAAALLAAQEPWWTPGDGSGYHAITFGTLLGELVRRVTGTTLGEFFAAEIARPLGADYRIGVVDEDPVRFASMIAPTSTFDYASLPADSLLLRTLLNPAFPPSITTDAGFLAAELGAANGQGNARSVALVQSIVSGGGVAGARRFLSAETVDRIFEVQSDGVDRVLGVPVRFGLGWGLPGPAMPGVPEGRVCWWTGFGGSVVVSDVDRDLTVAYVMNKMSAKLVGAPNPNEYLAAVYNCLS
ncbi:EstA family serine hydrolase [Gordonia neofelifaecis]|uniref:Beta-lactamase n=1 Tax=Gordonia neofelifaecis NRRL B-59395 TaxID=644548 RepID=F1YN36_9ACTN|nr:EstA family serine hydrolase [Gordonia neofelifaecis]EGD53923.1 beta-lactamase [Gordonia neofelifaecis NRRL B-59395]